jgi:copper chaperone
MIRKELIAAEMSCNHCKMTIENAVKGFSGVTYINADPATKKVVVEFDEKIVSLEDIKSAIVDAGYEVS